MFVEWRKFRTSTGLKTFSSKLPCEPAIVMATSLPKTCVQTMVSASDWVGFTLPGMMDEPGSFSGSSSSPRPERGPEPSQRRSFAIFIRSVARVLSVPCACTIAPCEASAANLLGAEVNGWPVSSAIAAAARSPKSAGAFSPVPTAVPPIASCRSPGSASPTRSRSSSSCAT